MNEITIHPIDIQKIIDSVVTPESGGIDVFIGTTRNHSKNRTVLYLEYESYEPMALKTMNQIEQEARSKWHLHKVAIVHRIGKVDVGKASVAIAVSSAHRKEAFEACRFLIDKLKQTVPIWKREYFSDGTIEWSQTPQANVEHV